MNKQLTLHLQNKEKRKNRMKLTSHKCKQDYLFIEIQIQIYYGASVLRLGFRLRINSLTSVSAAPAASMITMSTATVAAVATAMAPTTAIAPTTAAVSAATVLNFMCLCGLISCMCIYNVLHNNISND